MTTGAEPPMTRSIVAPLEANASDTAKAVWTGTPVESGKENFS